MNNSKKTPDIQVVISLAEYENLTKITPQMKKTIEEKGLVIYAPLLVWEHHPSIIPLKEFIFITENVAIKSLAIQFQRATEDLEKTKNKLSLMEYFINRHVRTKWYQFWKPSFKNKNDKTPYGGL